MGMATEQDMVFVLSLLQRVYNFVNVCPKQGTYNFMQACTIMLINSSTKSNQLLISFAGRKLLVFSKYTKAMTEM